LIFIAIFTGEKKIKQLQPILLVMTAKTCIAF